MTQFALNESTIVRLPTKIDFDRVDSINAKPTGETVGFRETSGSGETEDGKRDASILRESPILYKQNDDFMKNEGYFVIPRSIYTDSRFQNAPLKYQKIFYTILAEAAYSKTTQANSTNLVVVMPGQLYSSHDMLKEKCNRNVKRKQDKISGNTVQRALMYFRKCQFLMWEVIHDRSLITLTISGFYDQKETLTDTTSDKEVIQKRYTKVINKEDRSNDLSNNKKDPSVAEAPSKKRIKVPKKPQIERYKNVFTSELEHEKLIKNLGGEEKVNQIYFEISRWKEKQGISGGDDYKTSLKWKMKDENLKKRTEIKKEHIKNFASEGIWQMYLIAENKGELDCKIHMKDEEYEAYSRWKSGVTNS